MKQEKVTQSLSVPLSLYTLEKAKLHELQLKFHKCKDICGHSRAYFGKLCIFWLT